MPIGSYRGGLFILLKKAFILRFVLVFSKLRNFHKTISDLATLDVHLGMFCSMPCRDVIYCVSGGA